MMAGAIQSVSGDILESGDVLCEECRLRLVMNDFSPKTGAVIVTSGGIGSNHQMVFPLASFNALPRV